MTFSKQVKNELLVQDIIPKTAKIELIAVFKALGNLVFNHDSIQIEIKTSQIKLTKRVLEILKHEYPKAICQTVVRSSKRFNKHQNDYIIKISTHVYEILFDLKFIESTQPSFLLQLDDISESLYKTDEQRAYVKLFFCASGSVNDPKVAKQYHLEITHSNKKYLKGIQRLVKKYDINMKITKRKANYGLYLNKSEEISDFLKFINSTDMLFEFEDYRVTRDIILMNNRLNNADIANEVKRLNTSNKQIDAINYLKKNNNLNSLKEKTKKVAILRCEFPDDSLNELSKRTNGELSKPNISYHLKIIMSFYNEIIEKN